MAYNNSIQTPVYFVTSNQNKLQEVRELLNIPVENVNLELEEIQGTDLEEILRHKVQCAYGIVQFPIIVEDVALFFNAWNALPGPLIKWFLRELGVEKLVHALSCFEEKAAKAVCALGYTDGQAIHIFQGSVKGKIVSPRGDNGFGWDCIFQPEGSLLTYGEMTSAEKNKVSIRRQALDQFRAFLEKRE
ncbi:MAG: RdgB/HAM1 family non-canonical purine NTP pyrophosphatase [SAR324 cluster bacterium]|nr:RdgB/HAM1 family non-canonical purine NTP pyrophosphatase [SAR324 cluster bacterium]